MPRRKKYLDKTVLKAEYHGLHAEAVALWDGLPKQTAKTVKNKILVTSLNKSHPGDKTTPANAHELVKSRRESLRGVVAGLQIAAPADREQMLRWILMLQRTPSKTPLAERILDMALNLVTDNRKSERSDPRAAQLREYERVELFESVLWESRCLRKPEFVALISELHEWVRKHPATVGQNLAHTPPSFLRPSRARVRG